MVSTSATALLLERHEALSGAYRAVALLEACRVTPPGAARHEALSSEADLIQRVAAMPLKLTLVCQWLSRNYLESDEIQVCFAEIVAFEEQRFTCLLS